MTAIASETRTLPRLAWLSLFAAITTLVLKALAWVLTGSVGMLSDALETLVNLAGAGLAILMLTVAARPADDEHPYGHGKAEYFSSGVEGALILFGALGIAVTAVQRLFVPRALEQVSVGLTLAGVAAVINLVVAIALRRAGQRHRSPTLEASAHHLFADVGTTVGVFAAVLGVGLTRQLWIDPLVGLLISITILRTGLRIVRRAVTGLMDSALPPEELASLQRALAPHVVPPVQVHALRSRQSGTRRFISLHVLVPGDWTVHRGHQLLEKIEEDIRRELPQASVLTHLESLDDPASWEDMALDRSQPPTEVR